MSEGAWDISFRTPGHSFRVSVDREGWVKLVSCQPYTYHNGAGVEEVLGGLIGERRPDLVADAVYLCQDDGGPHSDGVCGRGHDSQALVGHVRDRMVEGLGLPGGQGSGTSWRVQRHNM